jgi:hypothetical protein
VSVILFSLNATTNARVVPSNTPDNEHYQRPPNKRNGFADRILADRPAFVRDDLKERIAHGSPKQRRRVPI